MLSHGTSDTASSNACQEHQECCVAQVVGYVSNCQEMLKELGLKDRQAKTRQCC